MITQTRKYVTTDKSMHTIHVNAACTIVYGLVFVSIFSILFSLMLIFFVLLLSLRNKLHIKISVQRFSTIIEKGKKS